MDNLPAFKVSPVHLLSDRVFIGKLQNKNFLEWRRAVSLFNVFNVLTSLEGLTSLLITSEEEEIVMMPC